MKISDFDRMTKVGDLKRMLERINADASDACIETFKESDDKFYQLDRRNRKFRRIYENQAPDQWQDLDP